MNHQEPTEVVRLTGVSLRFGNTLALDHIDLKIPGGILLGLIGPDGVGKSSLMSLIAGARRLQTGEIEVLSGNMRNKHAREQICPHIAYMPQGLGRNLYPTLSVEENLQFFGKLFGHGHAELRRRIDTLTLATGLFPFLDRPTGKLSGGMKQKLGLCCALIHDPKLLILDEPTTGVDPLARSQFWELIANIRHAQPEMSVLVATAYMDEAADFDWLVAMDAGKIIATGTPDELLVQTGKHSLESAFIALLPEQKTRGHREVNVPPMPEAAHAQIAIEAQDLTMRFGAFTAVDQVSFSIRKGEIFGFIGSNGSGKSTTMKMLTGLLAPSEGKAWLFGKQVNPEDIETRRSVGYMSQGFSLYTELSVKQNLVLHARLFSVPETNIATRVNEMLVRFGLESVMDTLPGSLPLGIRQRLSLAVAMVHKPEMLILDEPTSGVDPVARDEFWLLMIDLARKDKVTIFISTHFMNEAQRCDRMSLMHAGKVLITDRPEAIVSKSGMADLEQAFIEYIRLAIKKNNLEKTVESTASSEPLRGMSQNDRQAAPSDTGSSLKRLLCYSHREYLELQRDPLRAALALVGSLILMLIMGYGINMDVQDLTYAVLDRDQTSISQNYMLNLSGSRYFIERPSISSHQELDRRMKNGELALALEIPPGFGRYILRGKKVEIGAWLDGAMPQRAETVQGYVQGMHRNWLINYAQKKNGYVQDHEPASIEIRFRYNPEVRSLPAMVPAVIPMLLLMIPAMLTALSVVREKELGSIVNLYVTPVTRTEFLLGKQLPYIVLGMLNFFMMFLFAVTVFGVPMKGSFTTLSFASLIFLLFSTSLGLFASTFTHSQIAAIFITIIGTILPSVQFSGLLNPVSSLEGAGRLIGEVFPATYMFVISRGTFSKALGFLDLQSSFLSIGLAVPVVIGLAIAMLKKQES